MEKEVWKSVVGFENQYDISNKGAVRSKHAKNRNYVLKARIDRAGYYTVRLNRQVRTWTRYVHRLLAEAFIPNHSGKPIVNHINGNRLDNQLRNLEWCSASQNTLHGYRLGLCKRPAHVCKRVQDTQTGMVFDSVGAAARFYNRPYSTMKNALRGTRRNTTSLRYITESTP